MSAEVVTETVGVAIALATLCWTIFASPKRERKADEVMVFIEPNSPIEDAARKCSASGAEYSVSDCQSPSRVPAVRKDEVPSFAMEAD
jgi:hypothetical protein